jgi:RHS repeat-associated protein
LTRCWLRTQPQGWCGRLGSIDTLTDGEGVVVDKRTFDSFGRVLSESSPAVSFRYGYTGREQDLESGLDYYRARYYDSNVGRFISVDPMGFGAGDTNLYRYVGNNSTNWIDPTGLYSFDDFGRDAWNLGQGIGRNFDYSFDAINTNVFAPVGNAVVKPVVNAINTNFITPFNDAASNAVGFYTNLVNEGQREGGVVGTFKQGAGIFGGTFASTPGAVGSFVQNNGTRIGGLFQAIGGAGEIYAGATTSATVFGAPVGALLAANGVDNFQAGLRKLFTGEDANTLLYDATKRLTGSDKLAGTVDAATGLVLNAAAASAAAKQAADRALAAEVNVINQGERAAETAFLKTQCFIAGTEIQTINGTKNIEDIHVGDWVLSDDPNTVGEIEYKQVLNTFVKDTSSLVDIYIDGEKITTTEEHPFWVPDLGWVAAKDLHAGLHLQTKTESWLDVDKVELHGGLTTVYNFEVQGFHTYFVSDLGLLVHNACLKPDPTAQGPHSVFKLDNKTNKIRGYEEFVPNTPEYNSYSGYNNLYNPKFDKPWISVRRVDILGKPHHNKVTGQLVPTPHINSNRIPGGVEPALPNDIPQAYPTLPDPWL